MQTDRTKNTSAEDDHLKGIYLFFYPVLLLLLHIQHRHYACVHLCFFSFSCTGERGMSVRSSPTGEARDWQSVRLWLQQGPSTLMWLASVVINFAWSHDAWHMLLGRYGMARELMQRNLPFLQGLSLGEVPVHECSSLLSKVAAPPHRGEVSSLAPWLTAKKGRSKRTSTKRCRTMSDIIPFASCKR